MSHNDHVQFVSSPAFPQARRPQTNAVAPKCKPVAWWNRPLTWGIGGLLLLLALIGFMGSGKSHANPAPKDTADISVDALDIQLPPSATQTVATVEPKQPVTASQPGHVMVPSDAKFNGSPVTGVNNGTINVTNNWGHQEPVRERVVEKVTVVEKPVYRVIEKPVYVERPERPIVVHTTTVIQRQGNADCEDLSRENRETVASWKANPLPR